MALDTARLGEAAVYAPLGAEGTLEWGWSSGETYYLSWRNINVSTRGKPAKQILHGLSGDCSPGTMKALMGASGSGKTTLATALLNVLSRRGSLAGLDVHGWVSQGCEKAAFVAQDFWCVATDTPREAISFAAHLRGSGPNRVAQAEDLLRMLRLEKCADTYLGNDLLKGCSGGERRRTAVAIELVTDPTVIFLDEPTSGLDSYAAYVVIQLLRDQIAKRGKTVLCTIHQPSSEVFGLFETVDFLRAGKLVYSGQLGSPLRERFAACAFPLPPDTNPADHALFVFQTCTDAEALVFQQHATTVLEIPEENPVKSSKPQPSSLLLEVKLLARREVFILLRDPKELYSRVMMTSILGVLVSLCFKNAGGRSNNDFANVQTHFGAVNQISIMGVMAISQPLILTFPAQRAVLLREYAAHTYRIISYVASKLTIELFLCMLQSTIIVTICYWIMDLQGSFIHLLLVIALMALSTSSSVVLLSAFADKPEVAMQFAPLVVIPQMLFTGFFVRIDQIPTLLRWVQWVCALKYGINVILAIEFKDCHTEACNELFSTNNIHREDWQLYILALVAIFACFRFGAILVLRHYALRS
ncbi:hypothetical protein CTAYLR_001983 [Chrysophaeum taylorii]|uniref:ABC transporter domain-containing protein n=1 Tax=Chrysophaeum taylorii TaxID=2483200 RepID=A0AAD7XJ86_9STRA|nr:hypothetical protein CTAYLR_001983 [Chrysophaeum taylorii]